MSFARDVADVLLLSLYGVVLSLFIVLALLGLWCAGLLPVTAVPPP